MGYGVKLHVWGDYACFTRPEMKAERVSYDVITPSAARGILESIHWKPAIRWVVDRIHVLKEIKFESIRRNETESKLSAATVKSAMAGKTSTIRQIVTEERQQRMTLMLKNVGYIIEAHFEMTSEAGAADSPEKHYNIFLRRARLGQMFQQPYFGCREFPAHFKLVESVGTLPSSDYVMTGERDLQWMLWDLDYKANMEAKFFRAIMNDGVIEVPDLSKGEH
ncbi:type I-C CRISPR-associated protein Cas5c [Paenibacillus sp. P32E]|uniref:type I-C CRISPR-associated protein Cas5c n=1 Tax=Paenibacillus sp. P32E TaxID=1349434 RepID=UPI0009399045|nr:type I-C CRISPR-associated protein Cas5c [Paenibacillus sp. P32E]OKP94731.1 type I-C CRISPR-associated protein Cas5 [Paenibacillus sp. P32E]